MIYNRRAKFKLSMKHVNKKNQVAFEELTVYDKEVMGGKSNENILFNRL